MALDAYPCGILDDLFVSIFRSQKQRVVVRKPAKTRLNTAVKLPRSRRVIEGMTKWIVFGALCLVACGGVAEQTDSGGDAGSDAQPPDAGCPAPSGETLNTGVCSYAHETSPLCDAEHLDVFRCPAPHTQPHPECLPSLDCDPAVWCCPWPR